MNINLYRNKHTRFSMVFNRWELPFFQLIVPNITYNYNNPITCIKKALLDLERHELDETSHELRKEISSYKHALKEMNKERSSKFIYIDFDEFCSIKSALANPVISFLKSYAPMLDDFENKEEREVYCCESILQLERERLHKIAGEIK